MARGIIDWTSLYLWFPGRLLGEERGRVWMDFFHFGWSGGVRSGVGGGLLGSVMSFEGEVVPVLFLSVRGDDDSSG